jgi:protein-L-isoaspartate(D-aspartate) O-methyltransferase
MSAQRFSHPPPKRTGSSISAGITAVKKIPTAPEPVRTIARPNFVDSPLEIILASSERPRRSLVNKLQQLGITDQRVLKAIGAVPRHVFVDQGLGMQAYEDTALPIGHQQTISKPSVVSRMISLLLQDLPEKTGKVLEIGTGCGYQAALLSQVFASVYSVERIQALHDRAKMNLQPLRLNNISLHYSDGRLGLPHIAPFNAIILAAAGIDIPVALLEQLAIGGRLIAPVRSKDGVSQHLLLIERQKTGYIQTALESVFFVPLQSGVL